MKSGEYWVKPSETKKPFKVWCNHVDDGGGYTLFYNYIHKPYEDY
jgi:hypothetical protein